MDLTWSFDGELVCARIGRQRETEGLRCYNSLQNVMIHSRLFRVTCGTFDGEPQRTDR